METHKLQFFSQYVDRCKSIKGKHDFLDDKGTVLVAVSCDEGRIAKGEIFLSIYDKTRDVNSNLKVHDYIP